MNALKAFCILARNICLVPFLLFTMSVIFILLTVAELFFLLIEPFFVLIKQDMPRTPMSVIFGHLINRPEDQEKDDFNVVKKTDVR